MNRNHRKLIFFIWLIIIPTGLFSLPDSTQTIPIHDPWLAYDKVLHFGISFSLVLSTQYFLENTMGLDWETALPAGVTVSAANGLIKEYWDKKIGSFFSKRDLIADGVGILLGVFIITISN